MDTSPATAQPNGGVVSDLDLLRCLLDSIPDRIYFKDCTGHFLQVSQAEALFLGATSVHAVIGKSDFDYFARELAQDAFDDEQRVMETGVAITGKIEKKQLLDGRTGWAIVAKIPLRNADGALIGTCGISKDISALKETEMALHDANAKLADHKERLEQALADARAAHASLEAAQQRLIDLENVRWIARLAYGVAHEVCNPLATLQMGVDFLAGRKSLGEMPGVEAMLKNMQEAIDRADLVVGALMEGAVASGLGINADDIASTVDQAMKMMKPRPLDDGA